MWRTGRSLNLGDCEPHGKRAGRIGRLATLAHVFGNDTGNGLVLRARSNRASIASKENLGSSNRDVPRHRHPHRHRTMEEREEHDDDEDKTTCSFECHSLQGRALNRALALAIDFAIAIETLAPVTR